MGRNAADRRGQANNPCAGVITSKPSGLVSRCVLTWALSPPPTQRVQAVKTLQSKGRRKSLMVMSPLRSAPQDPNYASTGSDFSGAALNIVDQILISASNFLGFVLAANLLGLAELSIFSMMLLVLLLANSLHTSLVILPMMTLGPAQAQSDSYFRSVTSLNTFSILILTVVVVFLLPLYLRLSDTKTGKEELLLFGLMFIGHHAHEFFRKYLLLHKNFLRVLLADSILLASRSVGFGLLIFADIHPSLSLIIAVYSASYLLAILAVLEVCPTSLSLTRAVDAWRRHAPSAYWLMPSAILQWLSTNAYILIAPILLGLEAVAVLQAVRVLGGVLNVFFQSLEIIIPSQLSRLMQVSADQFIRYLRNSIVVGVLLFGSLGALMAFFSTRLMQLFFGAELAEFSSALAWYSLAFVLMYLSVPIRGALRVMNASQLWFRSYLITFIVTLLTLVPMQLMFGVNGAIYSLIVSYATLTMVSSSALIRRLNQ